MLNTTKIDNVKEVIGNELLQTLQEQFIISAIHSFRSKNSSDAKQSWKRTEDTMAKISHKFISVSLKDGKRFEPEVIKSTIQKLIDEQRKNAISIVAELVNVDGI